MTAQKKKRPHSKTVQKRAQRKDQIGLFFKGLIILTLISFMGVCVFFYRKYGHLILSMQGQAKSCVWSSDKATFRQYGTSMFFDAKGKLISSLSGERELYYVSYEDIPETIIDAVVTIEDKRFFEHEGVDYIANLRAAIALIQHEGKVTQGASTITQQLARNIFLNNEVTVERKLKEIFIASELEKKYSKQQILEFYLNNIYYANGYYGIQAAAKGYLNKSIAQLSLSEAAFLSAIPNGPNLYNPLTNIENTYKRRDKILKQMYEDDLISHNDYMSAKREKIKLAEQSYDIYNYVETYVYQCTIEALMEKAGFEFRTTFVSDEDKEVYHARYQNLYNEYQSVLYTSGYRIYTSIDLKKQEQLQRAVDTQLESFTGQNDEGVYQLQGSAVCIDNASGMVKAIVGGRSQKFSSYTLNRAYQSYRQPGSAIKPLIVYTPYFEEGHHPEELVMDEKTEDGPKNSNGVYLGEIDLRTAVEQSKNTIAWDIFKKLTPKKGLSYLEAMNFKKLSGQDEVLAASLGGLTYGTNTLEMTAAFRAIENKGVYQKPTCIVRIMNAAGELVLKPSVSTKRVYEEQASLIMTDVLTGVLTHGTGKGFALTNMVAAAKTGTTSDKKDGWFVGYTPYYTTGVWVGYDYPQTMADLYGNTYPARIWHTFMQDIHDGLTEKEFEPYLDTRSHSAEDTQPTEEQTEMDSKQEAPEDSIQEDTNLDLPEVTEPSAPVPTEPEPTDVDSQDDMDTEEIDEFDPENDIEPEDPEESESEDENLDPESEDGFVSQGPEEDEISDGFDPAAYQENEE